MFELISESQTELEKVSTLVRKVSTLVRSVVLFPLTIGTPQISQLNQH